MDGFALRAWLPSGAGEAHAGTRAGQYPAHQDTGTKSELTARAHALLRPESPPKPVRRGRCIDAGLGIEGCSGHWPDNHAVSGPLDKELHVLCESLKQTQYGYCPRALTQELRLPTGNSCGWGTAASPYESRRRFSRSLMTSGSYSVQPPHGQRPGSRLRVQCRPQSVARTTLFSPLESRKGCSSGTGPVEKSACLLPAFLELPESSACFLRSNSSSCCLRRSRLASTSSSLGSAMVSVARDQAAASIERVLLRGKERRGGGRGGGAWRGNRTEPLRLKTSFHNASSRIAPPPTSCQSGVSARALDTGLVWTEEEY
eukprot:scaffold1414_cov384-Prasinococcus_capsulatus_cf.AAC.10